MAAKINWRRYGTKLGHCHPVCINMKPPCLVNCKYRRRIVLGNLVARVPNYPTPGTHRCKKTLFYVFLFWSRFLRFFNVFFIFRTFFLFLENVGKVQSGKQINKKHFQNNSNEIDV